MCDFSGDSDYDADIVKQCLPLRAISEISLITQEVDDELM